ncbi:hypothetical protein CcrColossus_gp193 [Caulobacter phage CcrColossus]|uniref:Uncharacterized protein n=1 Tax=Caulobacter phage CcrColossus TaxID=1211640 RepID=K4JW10_9CAUD|nr:hypothetical protein CcrColossus_gp193 [Caulobacter phage CcrColossus]AFU88063.1 hypothetical protein CcrColossus_gp193 [Caulobacter phage CcrColossus]
MSALTIELSSLYNLIKPCESAWVMWAGALSSGAYLDGAGVLRSADNTYDPMGVLAAVNDVDWTWDERDEAWAFEGEVYTLSAARIKEWLGAQGSCLDERLVELQALLQREADNGATLAGLATALLEGKVLAEREHQRFSSARMRTYGGGVYPEPRMISNEFIDDSHFYGGGRR